MSASATVISPIWLAKEFILPRKLYSKTSTSLQPFANLPPLTHHQQWQHIDVTERHRKSQHGAGCCYCKVAAPCSRIESGDVKELLLIPSEVFSVPTPGDCGAKLMLNVQEPPTATVDWQVVE